MSGISNANTLHCNENGYWATYKSDRYGFNNDNKVWDSEIDIVLIGDSYTAGACVNPEDNISGNLQKYGLSVLNLGYGGNGPLINLGNVIEYVPLVQAKKIIWIYSNNDLDDLNLEKSSFFLSYLKKKSQNIHTKQSETDQFYLDFLKNYKKQSDFVSILKLERFRKNINKVLKSEDEKNNELNYEILINDLKDTLLAAKTLLGKKNQEFYFVYLPGKENFYPKRYADTYKKVNYLKPKILAMVKDLNINIIDMEQYLKDEIPSEMFPEKGHYNARGYQLIAEKLFESLQ